MADSSTEGTDKTVATKTSSNALSDYSSGYVNSIFNEQFSTNIQKLDLNSISQTRPDRCQSEELELILGDLKEFLVAQYSIVPADFILHLSMIIVRLNSTTCSEKYTFGQTENISYIVSGVRYRIYDHQLFPFLRALCKKHLPSVKNGVRKFASSCEALLVTLGHLRPDLFESARATRAGTPHGKGWLASDFISGVYPDISENERAVAIRARDVNLSRVSMEKDHLVSLYDIT
ncbi:minor coat protein [Fig virus A]|uniref:PdCP n=1 Tax=Fig closterovirus 2 TaxID=2809011 RepID=A0A8A0Y001_9CLOS|nr:minor coat protein [Fig virus A]QSQ86329.1 pdCP [Fig closterovirus 2]